MSADWRACRCQPLPLQLLMRHRCQSLHPRKQVFFTFFFFFFWCYLLILLVFQPLLGPFVTPQVNQNDAALRSWRTSHNEELKLQAADALRRNDAELDQAKKDLDIMSAEWEVQRCQIYSSSFLLPFSSHRHHHHHHHQQARKKKRHEKNVAEEKKFIAERDADKGEGKIWNRVARFVDLKGLESTHGDKDTSRMREVITAQIK